MDAGFNAALEAVCRENIPAVLVTITQVKGSTPRGPGAKMLILRDGRTFGTIGGGCGEAEIKREALNVFDSQTSKKYLLNMTNDLAEDEGMVCGGIMEVFINYIGAGDREEKGLLQAYLTALGKNREPVLVTAIASADNSVMISGKKLFNPINGCTAGNLGSEQMNNIVYKYMDEMRKTAKTKVLNLTRDFSPLTGNEEPYFQLLFEPNPAAMNILILGGGHIALPLATMAKILGYHVTVVDDRPSFANEGRFKDADRVICNDFAQALAAEEIDSATSVVIVTRGHRHDRVCLQAVIKKPARYIGMIGSRRRVKALLAEMEAEGVSPERLDTIHTPIGLDIGAETPEEIAISILAELIKVHRGGQAKSLKIRK